MSIEYGFFADFVADLVVRLIMEEFWRADFDSHEA